MTMKHLNPFLPALLCFGPGFLMIGIEGSVFGKLMAAVGAFMMALGAAGLFVKIQRLEKRIDELDGRGKGRTDA